MTSDELNLIAGSLSSVFAERPMPAVDAEVRGARRQHAIGQIERVLTESRPRPRVTVHSFRWGETLAVVALAAGLAIVVGKIWPDTASKPPMAAFRAIAAKGDILCDRNDGHGWADCQPSNETGFVALRTLENAAVTLEAPSGVRATMDAASTLLMTESKPDSIASRVTLTEGNLDVTVPKLGPNGRFSVVTPSATITVFGTAFSVEVKKPVNQPSRTCVRLREGIVLVSSDGREERLTAPALWGCSSHTEPANTSHVTGEADVPQPSPREPTTQVNGEGARRLAANASANYLDRSTLLAETRLLQRALGAERRNDLATAERSLRQLITLYPNSVVTPEAREALERIANKRSSQPRE